MAVNVLLKRSNTASKRPTAAQLDIGELSLNYDANTAGVFFEDGAGNVRKVGPTEVSATAPNVSPIGSSGNSLGELWYDTSTSNLKVWTGASFVAATATAGAAGSTTQVQFNSTGSLAGSANFTFDGTTASIAGLAITGSSIFRAAATQDGVAIVGRAGGSGSFEVTFTPTTLTADRTQTLQDDAGTVALSSNNLGFFAATTSLQLAGVISDETGSGALVFATSPTLTTPTLGVASATSINKVAITAPATSATLTIADGKTLTLSNTLTFTGTDTSSVAFGTGGTVAYTSGTLAQFAATTSAQLAGVISDETGSGALVFATSPTLVTPALGTPSALVGTNITGTATNFTASNVTTNANLTGHVTSVGNAAVLGSFTSAQLATALTDETGSGANVFGTSPAITTSLTTPSTTFALVNTTATTVNFAGAATALTIGAISGTTTVRNDFNRSGNISAPSWTTGGISIDSASAKFTDTSSAAAATVASRVAVSVSTPTFASTNAITVTAAASFYVATAPTAGTGTTITNSYALWVDAGTSRFDGTVLPGADNALDLGSTSFRWANIYTGDLHLKNDRGDYTIVEEEDALTLRNNKTGKVYNFVLQERAT